MILYTNKGEIISEGEFNENFTHYIKEDTYYDKKTCNVVNISLPEDFNIDNYEYVNNELVKVKVTTITRNQFNNLLGMETIKQLLIASKTDINIETFKWYLESCTNGIDLMDQNMINGLGYLLQQGYITQEKYSDFF